MNDQISELKRLGAVLLTQPNSDSGKFDDSELEVLLYEFKADLNSYLSRLGPNAPVRSLKDVINLMKRTATGKCPTLGRIYL